VVAGPDMGVGRNWNIRGAVERSLAEEQGKVSSATQALQQQGAAMLRQALSCGRHADVLFELDDDPGMKLVWGHAVHLCAASKVFRHMLSSGMKEDQTGVIRIRGVAASAVKGLLEWIYLGKWILARICSRFINLCVCVPVDWCVPAGVLSVCDADVTMLSV
jgi:hypothetical protein